MHQSVFSYNITRPYPFRWFTLTVVIGGIIAAAALFSFINVAATGYELYAVSSTDPETILAQKTWFSKWPSFIVSTHATCESTEIPLQTRLCTNNTGLSYTLYSVWKLDGGQKNKLGSLVYNNQPLQSCNITSILIDINVDDRTGGQMVLIPVGGTLTAVINCVIGDPPDRTFFQLFGSSDPVPPPSDPYGGFLTLNKTSQGSLYWGNSIMRLYWANLMMEFYNANLDATNPLYKGVVTIDRKSDQDIATAEEVMSTDFFSVSCFFNNLNDTGIQHDFEFCDTNHNSVSSLSNGTVMPNIWTSVNILGKATYFSVLADLGRSNSSGPNMLADPNLLANLSQNATQVNQRLTSRFRWGLGDVTQTSFDPSQAAGANLGVSPAVLTSNYICQLPRIKTGGTLFVSILVADLVLLQVCGQYSRALSTHFMLESGRVRRAVRDVRRVLTRWLR
jgi:hypothetical protein